MMKAHISPANIGESFVRKRYITVENKSYDVCSLGFVMVELMEPTTYILDPYSTELRNPEKWRDGIKNFLNATQKLPLEQLKYVRVPYRIRGI
jgi:hypothetical protein